MAQKKPIYADEKDKIRIICGHQMCLRSILILYRRAVAHGVCYPYGPVTHNGRARLMGRTLFSAPLFCDASGPG